MYQPLFYSLLLALPFAYFFLRRTWEKRFETAVIEAMAEDNTSPQSQPTGPIMQPPREDLAPPLGDPFTVEELKKYDGSDSKSPILVAIKGIVYDVSRKEDVYGEGKSYNLFAGKDASRALGKSSLKPEDAVSDYSTLNEAEMKVLDDWEAFFAKRYNIVGKVIDLPPPGSNL